MGSISCLFHSFSCGPSWLDFQLLVPKCFFFWAPCWPRTLCLLALPACQVQDHGHEPPRPEVNYYFLFGFVCWNRVSLFSPWTYGDPPASASQKLELGANSTTLVPFHCGFSLDWPSCLCQSMKNMGSSAPTVGTLPTKSSSSWFWII